jgi:AraC-like DNA-binding protein
MPHAHRHGEIELNFVAEGAITYLFGGMPTIVSAGRLALFWAAIPHQIVHLDKRTTLCWLTVPLALFLQWRMPDRLTNRVLSGRPVLDHDDTRAGPDAVLFQQWHDDLRDPAAERRKIVLLEIEARLRRLAVTLSAAGAADPVDAAKALVSGDRRARAEAMARYVAEHYAEPLHIAAIARAVNLHPNYAMSLFRHAFGMSLLDYLTQYRIADAQRLLATTDANVLDIAMESGFGSVSRFYATFKRSCGQPPRAYRAAVRQ